MNVGRYGVSGVIGSGGFGTVYRGMDPANGLEVAIKVLDRGGTESFHARVHAEADAMRHVDDPHCARVIEVIDEPGLAAIVTELVDGASLRAVLNKYGRLTGPQALDVLSGALRGLVAVHRAGLLHGDLKPDNVLVDRHGISKLIDFGLAATPSSFVTGHRPLSGSPAYMSPEQIRGEVADVRSDIYACAVMLFELLCGQRPYSGPNIDAVFAQHVEAPVPDPRTLDPSITEAFAWLCMSGMAKDPSQRPQTAAQFLAALEEAARERYGMAWRSGLGLGALVGAVAGGGIVGAKAGAGAGGGRLGLRIGTRIGRRAVFAAGGASLTVAAVVVAVVATSSNHAATPKAAAGGHLLVTTARGVSLFDARGRPAPGLPPVTSLVCCRAAAVSPDGTRVLLIGEGSLGAERLGGGQSSTLWASGIGSVGATSWSPDGLRVAFSTLDPRTPVPSSDVDVVNADGSGLRVVAHALNVHSIAWSPDGRLLAFTQNQGGIWIVSTRGGVVTDALHAAVRMDTAALPGSLSWSPARDLLFNEGGVAPDGVWEVAPDGSGLHAVLAAATSASWAPDGRHFAAIVKGRVVIADTTGRILQTVGPTGARTVQWSG